MADGRRPYLSNDIYYKTQPRQKPNPDKNPNLTRTQN